MTSNVTSTKPISSEVLTPIEDLCQPQRTHIIVHIMMILLTCRFRCSWWLQRRIWIRRQRLRISSWRRQLRRLGRLKRLRRRTWVFLVRLFFCYGQILARPIYGLSVCLVANKNLEHRELVLRKAKLGPMKRKPQRREGKQRKKRKMAKNKQYDVLSIIAMWKWVCCSPAFVFGLLNLVNLSLLPNTGRFCCSFLFAFFFSQILGGNFRCGVWTMPCYRTCDID